MLVLSYSDTHHLNRHMARCGCHDILIQRCITVLFLSNFCLGPIELWFCWLSYSNHSFQLISIQSSVNHSNPSRNHQSCNQTPFFSTSNWRQAPLQRHISCCHSNKACEIIAIGCLQNPLTIEIESARCSEKNAELSSSQQQIKKEWDDDCDKHRYPLASWFRGHILDWVQYNILRLLSCRRRRAVFSNKSSSPISCLNANERRTYSDAS